MSDPFVTVSDVAVRRDGDFKRKGADGPPYVSDPAGKPVTSGKRKGEVKWVLYGRPSNYFQIENKTNLQKWIERQTALGFGTDPTLADRAAALVGRDQDEDGWRDEADAIARLAKEAAKAGISAARGTHAHALTEDHDTERDWVARAEAGEELGIPREAADQLVSCWHQMLAVNQLEVLETEATIVNDSYGVAGTLDRIVRLAIDLRFVVPGGEVVVIPAGTVIVLDVKTGKRRVDGKGIIQLWHSYSVQVWLYASALPYDVVTETRGDWSYMIDQRWALIAHLDVLGALEGNPSCTLVLVDLAAGKLGADLCRAAKDFEALNDIFSIAQVVEQIEAETGEQVAAVDAGPPHTADDLPGMWDQSDLIGGETDTDLPAAPEQPAPLAQPCLHDGELKQVGRCVYCVCGARLYQGRLPKGAAAPVDVADAGREADKRLQGEPEGRGDTQTLGAERQNPDASAAPVGVPAAATSSSADERLRPCLEQSDCDCFFARAEGDDVPSPCPRAELAAALAAALTRRESLRTRCRTIAGIDARTATNMAAFWPDDTPLLTAEREITDAELDVIERHIEHYEDLVSAPFPERVGPTEAAPALRPFPTEDEVAPELPPVTVDEGVTLAADDPLVLSMKKSYSAMDAWQAQSMAEIIGEAMRASRSIHMAAGFTTRRVQIVTGLLALIHGDVLDAARDLAAQVTGVDACLFPATPLGAAVSIMGAAEAERFALAAAACADGLMTIDVATARLVAAGGAS